MILPLKKNTDLSEFDSSSNQTDSSERYMIYMIMIFAVISTSNSVYSDMQVEKERQRRLR